MKLDRITWDDIVAGGDLYFELYRVWTFLRYELKSALRRLRNICKWSYE